LSFAAQVFIPDLRWLANMLPPAQGVPPMTRAAITLSVLSAMSTPVAAQIVIPSDTAPRCKSYLAMSEHDAETFAAGFFAGILGGASVLIAPVISTHKFGEMLRRYCEEHPAYTMGDAAIELRRGMTR
jgi:hypothetical protein